MIHLFLPQLITSDRRSVTSIDSHEGANGFNRSKRKNLSNRIFGGRSSNGLVGPDTRRPVRLDLKLIL